MGRAQRFESKVSSAQLRLENVSWEQISVIDVNLWFQIFFYFKFSRKSFVQWMKSTGTNNDDIVCQKMNKKWVNSDNIL